MGSVPAYYPELSRLADGTADGARRICIITPDLLGADKNGGIGTACAYLAYALADAGHDTNILYCHAGVELSQACLDAYSGRGVKLISLGQWLSERTPVEAFPGLSYLTTSHAVYEWLRRQPDFDLALFMDWQGAGFYAMHAKACGRAFLNTALGVVVHSPSYWHSIHNGAIINTPLEACLWHMERKALEMADFVISPSQYMLQWCGSRICRLPGQAWVQPNLLEWRDGFLNSHSEPVEEVVFFGRLEFRKGLEQFCGAMDRLAARGRAPKKITFLGKCAWLGADHSVFYIARRAKNWPASEVALETQKDHYEAVEYLCGPGRLAVMPSIADNSPYTVYECLAAGVPFLARDTGGIGEFLPEEERAIFLFGDNPGELADKIDSALGRSPGRATMAVDQKENARAWRQGLPRLADLVRQGKPRTAGSAPFISVVLTHYNRPRLLMQALESLYSQSWQNFEVVLVDDGSTDADALACLDSLEPEFTRRGWRILRLKNMFAPAARNQGARAARGEWLLFFDDDNVAKPDMLGICAQAASVREGGMVALMFRVFEGDDAPGPDNEREIFMPTGDALAYSTIHNTLADTTSLIHKDTFWGAGGFREDYGIGHEDFELFGRLALAGAPVAILPEPVFWYRKSAAKSSVQLNTNPSLNRMRSLRPYLEMLPPPLAELALMTHSMAHRMNLFPEETGSEHMEKGIEPDSPRAMLQAAYALSGLGSEDLASQILRTLPEADKSVRAAALAARGGAASRRGDLEIIGECRRELESLGLPATEIEPFYKLVLQNLKLPAPELRSSIVARLEAMEQKTALGCLLIAGEAAASGNYEKAAGLLSTALMLADEKYLAERPDVGEAVRDGAFLCGLQHFCLHGRTDKTPWPEHALFTELMRKYPQLTRELPAKHMQAFGYRDAALAAGMLDAIAAEG